MYNEIDMMRYLRSSNTSRYVNDGNYIPPYASLDLGEGVIIIHINFGSKCDIIVSSLFTGFLYWSHFSVEEDPLLDIIY